jgi:succinoglycan biosynthesis protein ExoW
MNTNKNLTIIIPFYQNKKGILKKALNSIINQTSKERIIGVIIVDDNSPINAEEECKDLAYSNLPIKIIRQPNKGPAGARNTGINSVSPDTVYIAFLDSDDEWNEEHLSNAMTALESGYDFYFSDFYQPGQSISAFNRAKRINLSDHPLLIAENPLIHKYVGNMQEQIATGNIIGTPTVVYRYSHYPSLRFREDLIRAGEDYLFWLSLTGKSNTKIAFSSAIEVVCGKGVNIYSGTKYGTSDYMDLIYYETKYRRIILKEYNLSRLAKLKIKSLLKEYNLIFLGCILNTIRYKKHIDTILLIKYSLINPEFIFTIPINFMKLLIKK